DSLWIKPSDAIEAAQAGQHTIIWPTLMNLKKLARNHSVAEAWRTTQEGTVVTVLPCLVDTPQGKRMRIPQEAGYDAWDVDLATLMGTTTTSR
ncbi:MAG TPA: hypothetical protein VFK46_08885, partial [Candidatus Macondimonas sp.]|nr:hypothetical protein [Candidatus Macondimonas sp.]